MRATKRWRLRSSWWRPQTLVCPAQKTERQFARGETDRVQFWGIRADALYLEWLAEARGMTPAWALAYCAMMDKRKLISASHDEPRYEQTGFLPMTMDAAD